MTGTRVVAEPMGTPVGSLDELFGGFEEGTTPTGTEPMGTEPVGTTTG